MNVQMDIKVKRAKEHPVAQTHAKTVEHVRYRDQNTFAIVLLDTRDHIVVLLLVAQIHVKTMEHVMFSIVIHRPNTWLLVVVSRGSMETNVSTHHAQIIPV